MSVPWSEIYWSPLQTNVLDADRYELSLVDGTPVDVHRDGLYFVCVIRGQRFETRDNLEFSYYLNRWQVGGRLKPGV
ncbi:MAG: hypothetical protein IPO08_22710 [Xanthomonadales bacterium]|nr:hypothetical protein [Xanthomonadales bacterium]